MHCCVKQFKVVISVAVDFLVHIICFFAYSTYFTYHEYHIALLAARIDDGKESDNWTTTDHRTGIPVPSEPIACSKETRIQILKSKAMIMLVFESTLGTEPRFAVF